MASLSSIGSSGLQAAQLRLDASANNVANADTPALEQEAVEQMSAAYDFKASLQTIKTQDQMLGSLLDVKA